MKLFTGIEQDIVLLPYFLKHYKQLGIKEFFFMIVNGSLELFLKIKEDLERANVKYCLAYRSLNKAPKEYYPDFQRKMQDFIWANVTKDEWWAIADLDEFHTVIPNIESFKEIDYVMGDLVDRIALDGSIPIIDPNLGLEDQFPQVSRITEKIIKGGNEKVMMVKGSRTLQGGQHNIIDSDAICCPIRGLINHFKWHSNILEKMYNRANPKNANYLREAVDFLKYWESCYNLKVD